MEREIYSLNIPEPYQGIKEEGKTGVIMRLPSPANLLSFQQYTLDNVLDTIKM